MQPNQFRPNRRARARAATAALLVVCVSAARAAGADPSGPPSATPLPSDPVLAALIAQSLAARPELAQASSEVAAERERIPQAGALPDPMLQLGVQNDGFTSWGVGKMETSWYSIMASQTLPWPGKRRLQSEVVEAGANRVEQSVARLRLSTEAEVRRTYLDLVLARERLALLDRLESIWGKSATLARTRYESGQGAQSDVLRAQLEQNRLQQRRWAMQGDAAISIEALNRLRNHPLDEPIETSIHLADLPLPEPARATGPADDALARSPELAAATLGVGQAEKAVLLARKSYLPDFTLTAGVMPRGGEFPPMWLANVGVPIPIFAGAKQDRSVAEGEARVIANQKNVEAVEQVVRLRVQQRHTARGAILQTIHLYRGGLLIQSEATAESTLKQYEVGKVTFASVLEANAGLIADQDGYLQALNQVHQLEIDEAEVSLAPVGSASAGLGGAAMPGVGSVGGAGGAAATTAAPGAAPGGNTPAMSGM